MSKRGDSELAWSSDKSALGKKTEKSTASPSGSKDKAFKMRLESNGRGGKQVTVLFEMKCGETEARNLQKSLQDMLGTGGTYKDGKIELRGDVRVRVEEYAAKNGWKSVRAGG